MDLISDEKAKRFGLGKFGVLVALIVTITAIVLGAVLYWVSYPNFEQRFRRVTGLSWPESAVVESVHRTESGAFGSDYALTIHLQLSPADSQKWLAEEPFSGKSSWKSGPMNETIAPLSLDYMPKDVGDRPDIKFAYTRLGNVFSLLILDTSSGNAWLQEWSE